MTVEQALRQAREVMSRNSIKDAVIESEVLLRYTLNLTRTQLYLAYDREISLADDERFRRLIERRLNNEPTAYITGTREFYGLDFFVDRRALIPRPESELLVDEAIKLAHKGAGSFADIGTGSGAIAISLALQVPTAKIYATDISKDALEVASFNCRKHGVEHRVTLLYGDLLEPLNEQVDVIIANLPYVQESLLSDVNTHGYEPSLALDGGQDGLDQVRRLIGQAKATLKGSGSLLLEIGQDQDSDVVDILTANFPEGKTDLKNDLAGIPRVVSCIINANAEMTPWGSTNHPKLPGALKQTQQLEKD